MRRFIYFVASLILGLFPSFTIAKCYTQELLETKLNDVAFVVYCEDRSDTKAMLLVMSTIYNRADSYDINLLHNEVSKKNQYYCYNIKHKIKQVNQKEFNKVYDTVCNFITNKRSPITRAKYFYNYRTDNPTAFKSLTPLLVYGAHIYL